jgi:hypothetical protein
MAGTSELLECQNVEVAKRCLASYGMQRCGLSIQGTFGAWNTDTEERSRLGISGVYGME